MEYGDSIEDETEKVVCITITFEGGEVLKKCVPTSEYTSEEIPGFTEGFSVDDLRNIISAETAVDGSIEIPIFKEGRIVLAYVNLRKALWVEVDDAHVIPG